ncbi:MAG: cysteine--tRNA ligase, partial [Lactobacillus crispatus]|nr:cysteine--tRNA ligase [Lactobacillus crispatus]
NFVTVHDILREVDPQVLRFFMASVQYRRQINYSAENLAQAATILDRFKNTLTNINYRLEDDTASEESAELAQAIMATNEKFEQAMDDDFNVQNALTAIYDLLPVVNANANAARADKQELQKFKEKLASWLLVFGVDTNKLCVKNAGSNDDEIDALVKKRDE